MRLFRLLSTATLVLLAIFMSTDAWATAVSPYKVEIGLEPAANPAQRVLTVHMEYDYPEIARRLDATESLTSIAEVRSADLSTPSGRHEIRELPEQANYELVAEIPVQMDDNGFFTGVVTVDLVADDTDIVHAGKYLFWWKDDGSGPELISGREYYSWLMRSPARNRTPSTARLEPGDIPGERVIHPSNVGDIAECGENAVCPGRAQ